MRGRSDCGVRSWGLWWCGWWLVCLLVGPGAAWAQGLPAELQQAWKATQLPDAALSLEIREVGGNPITRIAPDVPRNPASVMKTVTTWTALAELGPAYVWRTRFLADAGARVDAQGTLAGPLYIDAAGDPWFTVEDLWSVLRELRLRGIKNLSEVVIDRSRFGAVAINPAEFDDSPDRPYNASPDAMMVNFGAVRILFQPDASNHQWVPIVDPPTRHLRVEGQVEWGSGRCPGPPAATASVRHQGGQTILQLGGKAVGSCGEFSLYRLLGTQQAHFEHLFRLFWRELGGTLAREVRAGPVPARARVLVTHDSPPLADVIRRINKNSNNVMARMTLLALGAEFEGTGATPATGARVALQSLSAQGVDTRGWVLDNGSGLSRVGRVTAGGLAQMLEVAWRSAWMPEFVSSLALSGLDGTVRRRLRSEEARGQAHLKTGTLRDVRALAGYVRGASGRRYIVVSLVNDPRAAAVRSFDDAVVRWLAAQ